MSVPEPVPIPEHHIRTRRLKRLLRFVPRRAVFHRYPVVGRFADPARRRAYLWSLKPRHVRPAIYLGSILALLPVMGVQLPIALVIAFAARANIMVAGTLQLITNPLSAVPIYIATYQVGRWVLGLFGGADGQADATSAAAADLSHEAARVGLDPLEALGPGTPWTTTLVNTLGALVVGGVICGLALGLILDVIYRQWFAYRVRHPKREAT